jgi:hypothetical protein
LGSAPQLYRDEPPSYRSKPSCSGAAGLIKIALPRIRPDPADATSLLARLRREAQAIRAIKAQFKLKIAVVNNEGLELKEPHIAPGAETA